jgi:hypothetical protein
MLLLLLLFFITMDEQELHHLKINKSFNLCEGEIWPCYIGVMNNHWA